MLRITKNMCIGLVSSIAGLTWSAAVARSATPPAYLRCEAYVGESQILDGLCRIRTLSRNRVMVEEFSDETKSRSGYVFLFIPNHERDTVLWNGEPNRKDPHRVLGVSQFLHTCWQSVAQSETPFSICLIMPTRFGKDGAPRF